MPRIFVVLLLMFLTVTLHAQDEQYRLITPTFADYADTLTEYGTELTANESSLRNNNQDLIVRDVTEIIDFLFPNFSNATFEQLLHMYEALAIGKNGWIDRDVWTHHMVELWLSENDVDLSQVNELQFEDFHIIVVQRDFNADGVNEYLLDVAKGEFITRNICGYSADVVDYLVVQQTDEGYHFIETHLPWNGYPTFGRFSGSDGGMVEIRFDDINADGLPEWILLNGGNVGGGPGMGYEESGTLLILGWQVNGLEFLSPNYYIDRERQTQTLSYIVPEGSCANGVQPSTVEWEFINTDSDAPLEILQRQTRWDNWYCKGIATMIFDWDVEADQYFYSNTEVEYEESQHCAQRDAEEIMWTGNYSAAIPHYERALTFEQNTVPDDSYTQSPAYFDGLNHYLRARTALAYLITQQPEKAKPLLDVLVSEGPADEAVMQFANALMEMSNANRTPLEICIAAYRTFTENYPELLIGFTGEPRYYTAPQYEPSRVGCDAPGMLGDTLSHQELPLSISPVNLLAELGVGAERVLQSDLNHDGLSEWYIVPDIIGMELFFAPEGLAYRVSSPILDPFMKSSDMQQWELPDGNSAIAMVNHDSYYNLLPPWRCVYDPICGMGGSGISPICRRNDSEHSPRTLFMWRLENSQLTPILQMPTCNESINDFPGEPSQSELSVVLIPFDEHTGEELPSRPTVYRWSSEERQYVYQSTAQAVTPTPSATNELPRPYDSAKGAFFARDFGAVILMTRDTVNIEEGESRDSVLADYFYRALSLQALGRNEEALSVFVGIHNIAPNHIWGILAALHFEIIE